VYKWEKQEFNKKRKRTAYKIIFMGRGNHMTNKMRSDESDNCVYNMCINNAKTHISENVAGSDDCVNAFDISTVIAICFCKSKEDVLDDLMK